MTRRSIIAVTVPPLLAYQKRISAAVIGQTGVNIVPYLKTLGSSTLLDRIAVCDKIGELFQYLDRYVGPRAKDLMTFRDSAEMLRTVRPELVIVSLEARVAAPEIQLALEAGAHVLVEKPGCTNIEDFDQLAALARDCKRHLMLALATRLHPAAIKAREICRSGVLGKPYSTTMQWVADQTRLTKPAYHRSWFASRARAGGGKLLFHGIHYLDLIRFITGDRITAVTGICRNVGGQPMDVEDAAVTAMRFASGWSGTLNTGYYLESGFSNLIQIWFSNGWLRFDPFTPLTWQVHGAQPQSWSRPDGDLYSAMMESAIKTVRGEERPFVTAAESRDALAAVFSTYRADELGVTQAVS